MCGCVSAASGDYFEVNTDLTTRSVEPIPINRVHVSSEEFDQTRGRWRLWPGSIEVVETFHDGKNASLLNLWMDDEFGNVVTFTKSGREFVPDDRERLCNTIGSTPSGRTNLKNLRLRQDGWDCFILETGSGEIRIFEKAVDHWIQRVKRPKKPKKKWYHYLRIGGPESRAEREIRKDEQERADQLNHTYKQRFFVLKHIERPNGNRVVYDYDRDWILKEISTTDRSGDCVLSSVKLKVGDDGYLMVAQDGQEAFHHQKIRSFGSLEHPSLVQTDCLMPERFTKYTYGGPSGATLPPGSIIRHLRCHHHRWQLYRQHPSCDVGSCARLCAKTREAQKRPWYQGPSNAKGGPPWPKQRLYVWKI